MREIMRFIEAEAGTRAQGLTGVERCIFCFSSRRRHTRSLCDWSSDVCSSDLFLVHDDIVAGVEGDRYAGVAMHGRDAASPFAAVLDVVVDEEGIMQHLDAGCGEKQIGRASCRERV